MRSFSFLKHPSRVAAAQSSRRETQQQDSSVPAPRPLFFISFLSISDRHTKKTNKINIKNDAIQDSRASRTGKVRRKNRLAGAAAAACEGKATRFQHFFFF